MAERMTNEELFDELLSATQNCGSDMATSREFAYQDLYESIIRDRLKDWLNEPTPKASEV